MNIENTNVGMIEFDGHVLKYPNGNMIYINLDEDDYSCTYDVFNSQGECLCESMCLIHQAHLIAVNEAEK